jgi:hypothetical protein
MYTICIHIYNYVIYHKISLTGLTCPAHPYLFPTSHPHQEDNECKKQQEKSSLHGGLAGSFCSVMHIACITAHGYNHAHQRNGRWVFNGGFTYGSYTYSPSMRHTQHNVPAYYGLKPSQSNIRPLQQMMPPQLIGYIPYRTALIWIITCRFQSAKSRTDTV